MATKDFDRMLAERSGERPQFTVAGQTFTARARLPYKRFKALLDLMRAEDADEDEAQTAFFNTVLIPEDRQRFLDALDYDGDDDVRVVDMSQLSDITNWMLEHFTGKAPTTSETSSPGPSSTGEPRKVVSLSPRSIAS